MNENFRRMASAKDPYKDRRYTLPGTVALIRALTGNLAPFDLDVAAEGIAGLVGFGAHAPKWYGPTHTELSCRNAISPDCEWWGQNVWCNPPWSECRDFVEKGLQEVHAGRAQQITFLLPATTDTLWWQTLIEPRRDTRSQGGVHTHFLPRQKFGTPVDPTGAKQGSPPFRVVVVELKR